MVRATVPLLLTAHCLLPNMAQPSPTETPAIQPRHVAIIMDGNGRWAQQRGLSRIQGHYAGTESVRETVRACSKLGIGHKQATADGMVSLEEVECMGACSWAPAVEINYDFHHNVTPEMLDKLLDDIRKANK